MSSSAPRGPSPSGVSVSLAVVLATISFFALAVAGLGAVSFVTDADIISVRGLGQAPGAVGMLAAVATFAVALLLALRVQHPSFLSVVVIALMAGVVHLAAVWLAVLIGSSDVIIATVVVGDLVRGGASVALLLAAAIAAWGGIALRRTGAQHPHWPWEEHDRE